jgi:hypothetical protein
MQARAGKLCSRQAYVGEGMPVGRLLIDVSQSRVLYRAVPCCGVLCRGVLNIVHGTHDTVNRILDHPDIAAVSFVGGDKAGRYIYERAAANGKRVQVSMCACRTVRACDRPCVLSSRQLMLLLAITVLGYSFRSCCLARCPCACCARFSRSSTVWGVGVRVVLLRFVMQHATLPGQAHKAC